PEVRKPGPEGARLGALDGLQRVLRTFRLADTGGAQVFGLRVGDVGNDVAEQASFRRLRRELVGWVLADERDEFLAQPLEAATVGAFVFRTERFEVRREARRRVALADKRPLHNVRCDRSRERGVGIDVLAMAPQEAKILLDLNRRRFQCRLGRRPIGDASEEVEHVHHGRLHLRPGLQEEWVLRRHKRISPSITVTARPPISARPLSSITRTGTRPSRPISVAWVATYSRPVVSSRPWGRR